MEDEKCGSLTRVPRRSFVPTAECSLQKSPMSLHFHTSLKESPHHSTAPKNVSLSRITDSPSSSRGECVRARARTRQHREDFMCIQMLLGARRRWRVYCRREFRHRRGAGYRLASHLSLSLSLCAAPREKSRVWSRLPGAPRD